MKRKLYQEPVDLIEIKPREWTLRPSHRNNNVWYASTKLDLHQGYNGVVHVIEKSAYDELEARVKGLTLALGKTPCTGNGDVHIESCFKCAMLEKYGML